MLCRYLLTVDGVKLGYSSDEVGDEIFFLAVVRDRVPRHQDRLQLRQAGQFISLVPLMDLVARDEQRVQLGTLFQPVELLNKVVRDP